MFRFKNGEEQKGEQRDERSCGKKVYRARIFHITMIINIPPKIVIRLCQAFTL